MSSTTVTTANSAILATFDRTTSRWGRLTMIAALVMSLAAPFYLIVFADLGITSTQVWIAFLAVAAVFSVFWVVEPITYFPILGPAGMYQAFMIGNIQTSCFHRHLSPKRRSGRRLARSVASSRP